MNIRPAVEADIPRLLPLMRALAVFEEYINIFGMDEEVLRERGFRKQTPDFYALVADDGEALRGMLVYYFIPFTASGRPTLFIKELYVDEGVRGQGIGKALMTQAARIALENGCGSMRWAVANWNDAGKKFYEQLGAQANPVWIDYGLSYEAMQRLVGE